MILLPHHIESGNGQGTLTEVAHQRMDLGGKTEPAFDLFLAELAGLAHKEVTRLLMVDGGWCRLGMMMKANSQ